MAEYIYRAEPIGEGEYSHTLVGELVRCGECKWYRMEYGWNCIEYMVCGISPTHHPIRLVNDFCSYGERKETDDE